MSGRHRRPRSGSVLLLGLVAVVLGGCSVGASGPRPSPTASSAPTVVPATTGPATTAPSTAVANTPVPTDAPGGGPPVARLAAEGGDPVEGQLGTYLWADGGSDSPWLPGAPITVGAREPLAVMLDPVTSIETWRARIVASGASGPAGATVLAEGAGPPRFAAPEGGAWVLEIQVTFADGLGTAHYAWALTVA